MLYVYDKETKYFKMVLQSIDAFNKLNVGDIYAYTEVEIPELSKGEYYHFDEENNTWIFDQDKYEYDLQQNYLDIIKKVAAKLTDEAPYLILPGVPKQQVDNYKLKYEKALEGDKEFFEWEAQTSGVSVDDLINIVLQNGEQWKQIYDALIAKIEGVRRGTKLLVCGKDFEHARRGIVFMKYIFSNPDFTPQMYLDYTAGLVDEMGQLAPTNDDGTPQISSVIDILGFIPPECD